MYLQITALVVSMFSLALSLFALANALKMGKEFDQNVIKVMGGVESEKRRRKHGRLWSIVKTDQG